MNLNQQFGQIDIYLFDQLLKGRITPGMRILDAGCGSGRNLVYLLKNGFEVYAVDRSADAIAAVQRLGSELAGPRWREEQARVEAVETLSFERASFDYIISSAVLHFAENDQHFDRMTEELWRVLKPGGRLFARLASSIGIESQIQPLGAGRYILPDGSTRYLVSEEQLMQRTERLGGKLFEPLKTVQVAGQRCMSTWCVRKDSSL